jgi:hypothetical protein
VPVGGDIGHGKPQLKVTVTPKQDRKAPYRFVATVSLSKVDRCEGKLLSTVSAKLTTGGKKSSWRPLGRAQSTTLHSCTAHVTLKVSPRKLAKATKQHNIPLRVSVVYLDLAGQPRVTTTVTVKAG